MLFTQLFILTDGKSQPWVHMAAQSWCLNCTDPWEWKRKWMLVAKNICGGLPTSAFIPHFNKHLHFSSFFVFKYWHIKSLLFHFVHSGRGQPERLNQSYSKIFAPVLVIGSLIVGLLLALLVYKRRSQREYPYRTFLAFGQNEPPPMNQYH